MSSSNFVQVRVNAEMSAVYSRNRNMHADDFEICRVWCLLLFGCFLWSQLCQVSLSFCSYDKHLNVRVNGLLWCF